MDNRSEVRAFLSSRRAKVSPEQAGLPAYGSRRVAGLRRGEVAVLAGVSVVDWPSVARSAVAALRIAAAQNPDDQQLMNLIGELSMRSEPFRGWWAAQDVFVHRNGVKCFRHPAIGELELDFELLELPGDEALTVLTYSAEPGTPSGDGLELLATWAATQKKIAVSE